MNTAFDKIASGLGDAIAYADGDKTKGCVATGQNVRANWAEPNEVRGEAASAGRDGARLQAAPALAGYARTGAVEDGGC